ncbi:MAG: cyclic-di-AMP receptor [Chloroflexia bacterium]|nr:cyclic-di-AMP receptor [Chloroflexia bacterium]
MKLVIAVVQGKDVDRLLSALGAERFQATQVSSAGGFLRESNVTLLIGIEDESVPRVREVIKDNCHSRTHFVNPLMPIVEPGEAMSATPVEVPVGGATVFVVDVQRFERFQIEAGTREQLRGV